MPNFLPLMSPAPGERRVGFVGDRIVFTLRGADGTPPPAGWRGLLRINLGRGPTLLRDIIRAHATGAPFAGESWRDLPMRAEAGGWSLALPLVETGFFKAKAYALDERGWQHWPSGADFGLSVQPDFARTANTIYCAFPRLFGPTRTLAAGADADLATPIKALDARQYSVIPPSGKLRDLIPFLPHIADDLGCRILHLLPISPTPTTFARFGRYGSPYAALDLAAIDPALVVFDKRTTGVDQFRELAYATHCRGARLFLDIVINHTGWGSTLFEQHPGWFQRQPDGEFHSPGAWGNTWEDLVELKHDNVALWDEIADSLLTWCRRGVDGFRCDAGYMVPLPAWQYIIARVRQEFPDALFLLEGLGGAWETTAALLGEGGMQWAYSELFQNYSGVQVSGYLDHAWQQSHRAGLLIHYSETHDNARLAAPTAAQPDGRAWSLLRNRLCGLASVSGGYGFTGGVEWLATEKINVHGCTGLNWDVPDNLNQELAALNRLLAAHPCFFDGAKLTRLSAPEAPVLAFRRESAEGKDAVLVLVNLDTEAEQALILAAPVSDSGKAELPLRPSLKATQPRRATGTPAVASGWDFELLEQPLPICETTADGAAVFTLPPGAAYCLAATPEPRGLYGEAYRMARAQAAWAMQALYQTQPDQEAKSLDWRELAAAVERSPAEFLVAAGHAGGSGGSDESDKSDRAVGQKHAPFPNVIHWSLTDRRRITPVPPGHWLLIEDDARFRATLATPAGGRADASETSSPPRVLHVESFAAAGKHFASFPPRAAAAEATLELERYADSDRQVTARIRFLAVGTGADAPVTKPRPTDVVLLTNGRGGMARLRVDLGRIESKYDCALGANLHPRLPVDRHVFAKRIRAWVNADGFVVPLDSHSLRRFEAGPPARWHFTAHAGDGRIVELQLAAELLPERNTTLFHFTRPTAAEATGRQLPDAAEVRLILRVDIEDRSFHSETHRNGGAEHHFTAHVHASKHNVGFTFAPAADRHLHVYTSAGEFHSQPEWSEGIAHPVETSRGQTGAGDAWSPGWFELPLRKGVSASLVLCADSHDPSGAEISAFHARVGKWGAERLARRAAAPAASPSVPPKSLSPPASDSLANADRFTEQLILAARAFVVRRDEGKTVVAGYPWFLDWGRDTLICARGLLAGGMTETVQEILLTFARYEESGTLPNIIHGEHVGNRDTSDAPLWFAVVAEELAETGDAKSEVRRPKSEVFSTPVNAAGRTVADVLRSIAANYVAGTPNGIRMDPASALIFSPSHFTWMDTNYPAGTPREGYPIEIQCLWIRLVRLLARLGASPVSETWSALAERAQASLEKYFWLETKGWYADVLLAPAHTPAAQAVPDDALRSNCLFTVSLGLVTGERARRCVAAARHWLVVRGALRTLAPLPVGVPLAVRTAAGQLLNDPAQPYWGRYEGDEDTRRKPAYHNGTAWTWTFPVFCEALARAWEFSPAAVAAANAYLGSMGALLAEGCLGQLPEIVDGDAPHAQRGCDAQAWGVTEALRVARLLGGEEA
jgi:glycogen debranching enzyme